MCTCGGGREGGEGGGVVEWADKAYRSVKKWF